MDEPGAAAGQGDLDPRVALLLRGLDTAFERKSWHGTTLKGSLRGITPARALWRPSPTRKSTWEYLLHAAYWKFAARRELTGLKEYTFERKPQDWPRIPAEPTQKALRRDVAYLKHEHALWRAAVAALPPARLDEPRQRGKSTCIGLILGVTAHDLYHAGQIQLLKRLYREATGG